VGSHTYKTNEPEVDRLAPYLGFGFLFLVDLCNDICMAGGSSSLDINILSHELAGDLVGELTAEPVGSL